MQNKLLIKNLFLIFLIGFSQPIISFFRVTSQDLIKQNIEHDHLFRGCLLKTLAVNILDAKSDYGQDKIFKTFGDVSFAAITAFTIVTYPKNGKWDSYQYFCSERQINFLKLATVISVINASLNTYFKIKKNPNCAKIETLTSACCCAGPLTIIIGPTVGQTAVKLTCRFLG